MANIMDGTPNGDVFYGTIDDDYMFGKGGNDFMYGDLGNDYMEGGTGADTMLGGIGSDTISYVHSFAGVSINLKNNTASGGEADGDEFSSIENVAGSAHQDNLTGNNVANVLEGGGGDDFIWGEAGNDKLYGGAGKDYLIGGTGADVVDGGDGIDDTASYLVSNAGVMVDLTNHTAHGGHAEGDQLSRIEWLQGSQHQDFLVGDGNSNRFWGNDGDDYMWGRSGRDVLFGDGGKDWLEGGADRDWLTGGAGADQFVFASVSDSAVGLLKRDVIEDFNHAEGDKINVANINAKGLGLFGVDSAFNFIGEQEFSFAGQLRVTHELGNTVIQGNTFGTGGAEFEIELTGNHTLVASDFVL